ncbi:MAG TPA: cobyrinate a,c-diamide synthase [Planctomycetota bacterium]|jgi:cobyrinic acid a,c-diamide synthase
MGCARIVIAGTSSGVGKTSLTLALTYALTRRGKRVQTFKVGPDFLDPSYLAIASGRPCYNLDGWMTDREYVRELFERASAGADIAVVEGVMGLFDGADPRSHEGSTAEIALWLSAPILLVTNAHGAARSLAATVKGFCDFEPSLRIAGVIANQAGSERHAQWLRDSLSAANLPPLVGAIQRGAFPELPSRHLGLVTADRENLSATVLAALGDALDNGISVEDIARLAGAQEEPRAPTPAVPRARAPGAPSGVVRLGVAFDAAFHFYYPDNLEALESAGCEIVRFSPISDAHLPKVDALYLGGGYPEQHAAELSANASMLADVRAFAAADHPVYAECGGLMYLSQGIHTLDGKRHAMAGVLPVWTRMLKKRKALGYTEVTLREDSLWGKRGATLRGHEFHYSELVEDAREPSWRAPYTVAYRRSDAPVAEGFQRGRTLASYIHAHFASRPDAVANLVASFRSAK